MPKNTIDYGIILPSDFIESSSFYNLENPPSLAGENPVYEPVKERGLWRRVILQAVLDAALAPLTPQARRDKTKAIIWFSMHNEDFLKVCEMAGEDPASIIRRTKLHIKRRAVVHKRKSHMKRIRSKHIGGARQESSKVKGIGTRG